jgi:triosephosphate isomerase
MSRTPLVAANWKMYKTVAEARAWCDALREGLPIDGVDAVVFPSFPLLPAVVAAATGAGLHLGVGGQDLHPDDSGAHTGDVSGAQLLDVGCGWVLVGHSERRHDHREDDALVAAKLAAAARHGLRPIFCLGETRDERRSGNTFAVLERQLAAGLPALGARPIVAYEPVWAIGTGETATPAQAQEAHAFLRGRVAALAGEGAAAALRLLYGGSVKPENAAELGAQPDVDGFLVGGASLDAAKFLAIMRGCGAEPASTGGIA